MVPMPNKRGTGRKYVALVTLLALSGAVLAVLTTTMVTRADPSVEVRGAARPYPRVVTSSEVQTANVAVAADLSTAQAFGWLYHHEYPLDESGEQIAFGITRDAGGLVSIQALGFLWNRAAGLDVRFEIPAGLTTLLPLPVGRVSSDRQLSGLRTEPVPTTFIDRSGDGGSSSHAGTVTFEVEGAGDVWDEMPIEERFSPYAGGWIAFFSGVADSWRLAMVTISFDCPDLGIFQLAVSDWENDFVEIFEGPPLQVDIVRRPATLAERLQLFLARPV